MKILGIDTSTKFLSLGLSDKDKIYTYCLETATRLSLLLGPTIQRILEALGWRVDDVDYFACGLGPGSFTGLRIGLSTIKGIGWSLKKPLIGIPTLDILARNAQAESGLAIPVVDAKRNLIYSSIYAIKGRGIKRVAPYMLVKAEDLIRKIKARIKGNDNILVFGDALNLYRQKFNQIGGLKTLDKDAWYPGGQQIINLAREKIKEKKFSNAFNIKPIYLYPRECQIKSRNP